MAKRQKSPTFIFFTFILVVALLGASGALGGAWMLGAFDEPTPEELRATVFDDGLYDGLSFEGDATAYTRRVHVTANRLFTVDEVVALVTATIPNWENAPEEERASYEGNLRDQIMELANEDGLIPQNELLRVNEGFFSRHVPRPVNVAGVLVGDHVVFPTAAISSVLQIPQDAAERVTIIVTVLADSDVEDEWKKEELFNGTALELVESSKLHVESKYGVTYFERPAEKILADPGSGPYEVADLEDVDDLSVLVYPRLNSGIGTQERGTVAGVLAEDGYILLNGHLSAADFGTPVFLVRDGELVWAGVLISATRSGLGIVLSAKVIQDKTP